MFHVEDCLSILSTAINFHDKVPVAIANRFVKSAVMSALQTEKVNREDLRKAISTKIAEYISEPNKVYQLVTTISLDKRKPLSDKICLRNCTLKFKDSAPEQVATVRKAAREQYSDIILNPENERFCWAFAETVGRSAEEAAEFALSNINLLRGVWNMVTTKVRRISFGNRRKAISNIVLGELHTIHDIDGTSSKDMIWYEPDYDPTTKPFDYCSKDFKAETSLSNVLAALETHRYGVDIENAIVRYVRSLDQNDYSIALTSLWQVLEKLTTTGREPNDKIISRVSFLFEDWNYHGLMLRHLKEHQNDIVHNPAKKEASEIHVFQLKEFVERVIRFHLANRFKFSNLADAIEFMDLPPDSKELKRRRAVLDMAIEFRA